MDRDPRVLLGVCGGIAAYKAVELLRRLKERGFDVRCALSRSAASFVTPLTFEVLSGHAVYEQEYLRATGRGEESHITAGRWADVLVVVPATAHVLARLALGLADDFLTTTALAFRGPLVLAPAMHSEMWAQEAVQRNVDTLAGRGARFVGPEEGPLASGEQGMGRLAAPPDIVEEVARCLVLLEEGRYQPIPTVRRVLEGPRSFGPSTNLIDRTVLVSAGPTYEPIDPVRFLGNRSSGKMGYSLAEASAAALARTILVSGPVALPTPPGVERIDVETALEMRDAIYEIAPRADLIIMTAAVSDFRPRQVAAHKLKKGDGVPRFELETNPDILAGLAEIAPEALRVGFAAETQPSVEEAYAKLRRKRADLLVWNNVASKGIGFASDDNEVTVYRESAEPVFFSRRPKEELGGELLHLFSQVLKERAQNP